jgi:hypothetical protein
VRFTVVMNCAVPLKLKVVLVGLPVFVDVLTICSVKEFPLVTRVEDSRMANPPVQEQSGFQVAFR